MSDPSPRPGPAPGPLGSWRRALGWSVVVLAVALAVSGAVEFFAYHPLATTVPLGFQRVHRIAGTLFGLVAAAWCFVAVVDARRHGVRARVGPLLAFLVAAAATWVAWSTGPVLAWDQVALWAVMTGTHVEGVLLGGLPVKFVIVDHREYTVGSFRQAAWVHSVVAPALGFVALAALGRLLSPACRSRRPGVAAS